MEERCRLVLEIDFSTSGTQLHVESSTSCQVMRDLLMMLTSTLQNPSVSSNHIFLIHLQIPNLFVSVWLYHIHHTLLKLLR